MCKVPPHFELLGTISPKLLSELLNYINKVNNHPTINLDIFPFIRLHVAKIEEYKYCINLNTIILKDKGYDTNDINKSLDDISNIPFDDKNKKIAEILIMKNLLLFLQILSQNKTLHHHLFLLE